MAILRKIITQATELPEHEAVTLTEGTLSIHDQQRIVSFTTVLIQKY